jgi:hypothetical protein
MELINIVVKKCFAGKRYCLLSLLGLVYELSIYNPGRNMWQKCNVLPFNIDVGEGGSSMPMISFQLVNTHIYEVK